MYFKLLEVFIFNILFKSGEYNINNKNFNPLKVLVVSILVCNLFFTIFLLNKIHDLYIKINKECPNILEDEKNI